MDRTCDDPGGTRHDEYVEKKARNVCDESSAMLRAFFALK